MSLAAAGGPLQQRLPARLALPQLLRLLLVVGGLQTGSLGLQQRLEGVDVVLHAAGQHADVGVVLPCNTHCQHRPGASLAYQLLVTLVHTAVLLLQHFYQTVLAAQHLVTHLLLLQDLLKQLRGGTLHLFTLQCSNVK